MGYKEIVFDLSADQPLNSKSCGFYCLRYIIDRQWKDMTDYIWFIRDNTTSNDHLESWDMDLNVRPELKKKIKKNNEVYKRTLK